MNSSPRFSCLLALLLIQLSAGSALAATDPTLPEESPPVVSGLPAASGLPLPRFVTTRSDSVNVRSGPGERYPVQWVLQRKGIPVEITAEYENWRKIRDWEGTEGWVHQALLSGRRQVVVYPADAVLRRRPDAIATPLARLQKGLIGRVIGCEAEWCELTFGEAGGWVSKEFLWGVYPSETIE